MHSVQLLYLVGSKSAGLETQKCNNFIGGLPFLNKSITKKSTNLLVLDDALSYRRFTSGARSGGARWGCTRHIYELIRNIYEKYIKHIHTYINIYSYIYIYIFIYMFYIAHWIDYWVAY